MDYDPHISVEPISTLSKPDYSIKEIHLEHVNKKIKTPFKVLSCSNIDKDSFNSVDQAIQLPLLESGRFVFDNKSLGALNQYLTEYGGFERATSLNQFFKIKNDLWNDSLTTLSLIFERNPFSENVYRYKDKTFKVQFDWDGYSVLLDYIHDRSKAFILTPDFRLKNSKLSIEMYLQYMENSLELLSKRNKKPIFAPLQIEMSKSNLNAVISKYAKLGVACQSFCPKIVT